MPRSGGLGLVGVPRICQSVAARGHQVDLLVAGDGYGYSEADLARHQGAKSVLPMAAEEIPSSFSEIDFPAYGRWAFAPTQPWIAQSTCRKTDFVLLHSLHSFPVLLGYLLARLNGKPYGIYLNGVLAPFQRLISFRKKFVYERIIARRILDEASFVVCSSVREQEETIPLKLTAPSIISPLGIDTAPYCNLPARGQFRDRYFNGHEGPLLLYLGRLNSKKGLDLLTEAVALVVAQEPNVRLAIVGSSDPPGFADEVIQWIHYHGLDDRTVMTGLLTGPDKLSAFADADLFVLPSQAENFCFALFESMSSRLPVVISDTVSWTAEVASSGAGLVVPRDPGKFAAAIVELLADKERRLLMGEQGHRLAQSFSWEKSGERLERAIDCVLRGNPLPSDLTQE